MWSASTPGQPWFDGPRWSAQTGAAQCGQAAVTDDSGTVVERYGYDSHGSWCILNPDGSEKADQTPVQPYGFTGRRYDGETGLWYFRSRYFDSGLGRFIGRDPLGYVDGYQMYMAYFVPNDLDPHGRFLKKLKKAVKKVGNTITDAVDDVGDAIEDVADDLKDVYDEARRDIKQETRRWWHDIRREARNGYKWSLIAIVTLPNVISDPINYREIYEAVQESRMGENDNRCTMAPNKPRIYGRRFDFTEACKLHDACYYDSCFGGEHCHDAFKRDLRRACESQGGNDFHRSACKRVADLYYEAVKALSEPKPSTCGSSTAGAKDYSPASARVSSSGVDYSSTHARSCRK